MQLNACYYPYSRFDDLESLKRACVIFDTVRLLEPNPVDLLMTPEWDRKHLKPAWLQFSNFIQETDQLREAGVLIGVEYHRPEGHFGFSPAGESLWWDYEESSGPRRLSTRMRAWLPYISWALEKHEAVPWTDDRLAEAELRRGFKEIIEALGDLRSPSLELDYGLAELATNVIRAQLPPWDLKSFDDVLYLRDVLNDSLMQLRTYLGSLIASAQARPWDQDFARDIATIVRRDIDPALVELRQESNALRSRYAGAVARSLVSFKPLALIGTVLVGVPPELAIGAAGGAAAIDTASEMIRAQKSVTNHGLALLLDHRAQ